MCYVQMCSTQPLTLHIGLTRHFIIHSLPENGRYFYPGFRRFPYPRGYGVVGRLPHPLSRSYITTHSRRFLVYPLAGYYPFSFVLPIHLCMLNDPPLFLIARVVITIHPSPHAPRLHHHFVFPHRLHLLSPGSLDFPLTLLLNGFPVHVHTHIPPSCPRLRLYRLSIYLSVSFCPPPRSGRPSRRGRTGEGAREMEEGAK